MCLELHQWRLKSLTERIVFIKSPSLFVCGIINTTAVFTSLHHASVYIITPQEGDVLQLQGCRSTGLISLCRQKLNTQLCIKSYNQSCRRLTFIRAVKARWLIFPRLFIAHRDRSMDILPLLCIVSVAFTGKNLKFYIFYFRSR